MIQMVAAVVTRAATDEELVAIFAKSHVTGKAPVTMKRSGIAAGFGAMVVGRSKNGEKVNRVFYAEQHPKKGLGRYEKALEDDEIEQLHDWTEPDFPIDPELDTMLAEQKVPGAIVHIDRRGPMATHGAVPASPEIEIEDVPFDFTREGMSHLEFPWEAARLDRDLRDLRPVELGTPVFGFIPASDPPAFRSRSLEDLLAHGWSTEAQAVRLVVRFENMPDLERPLQTFLAASVPPLAKIFACAAVAELALHARKDVKMATRAGTELVRRVAEEAGGDVRAWIAKRWPKDARTHDLLGTVAIS